MTEGKLLVKGVAPPPLDRELTVVGRPLNRYDAREKVTGEAKYAGDIKLPGMLYAKTLHCPHPRARILKIDTGKAEDLPGVMAVLTKENTKGWRTLWYEVPEIAFPETTTHEGSEVAAVAAVDVATARRALELIEVEYELLRPMPGAEEALKHATPPLVGDEEYPGRELYDRKPFVIQRGDIEKGFEDADVIVEDTYTTQVSHHGTIQTRACVADWNGHTLTVWDAAQGVWNSKLALARSLNLNPDNVRVIVRYLGGGFGSKAWSHRTAFFAAKLSMITGKPVRIERTRHEEFINHSRRYDTKMYLKMGAKKDGTLTAILQKAVVDWGAAVNCNNYFSNQIIWHTANLHACPNVYLEQTGVATNKQTTGPTRSPMNMQAIFALESHMDRMAVELGMDPFEFRMKNYATFQSVGAEESTEGAGKTFPTQIPYSSKTLDECMRLVTDAVSWEKRQFPISNDHGPVKRGIGMSSYLARQGVGRLPNAAGAKVVIKADGTINLLLGIVDVGAGQKTVFGMIASEELGVAPSDVTVCIGDTADTLYAPSSHSSRCTSEVGPAVLQAAAEARKQVFAHAAALLGSDAMMLRSKNGLIYVQSNPSRSIPFKKACQHMAPEEEIIGIGQRAPNPAELAMPTFGAQAVELEVDTETGQVTVLKCVAAQDFGKPINPKLCTSQVYGGIQFGVGFALTEEAVYDPKTGILLTGNFSEYRMPTSLDFPPVEVYLPECENPYFAYSAKGGGENTNAPTPAAICNALFNATGIWFKDLPITPDKIIRATHPVSGIMKGAR